MSSIINTSKVVYELAKKGMTVELQEKIMQLREEALELQEENLTLKKENLQLKEKNELQEKVKFKRKVYFRDGDEIPFCPYCFEKSGRLIHLSLFKGNQPNEQLCHCQECYITYRVIGEGDFTFYSRHK